MKKEGSKISNPDHRRLLISLPSHRLPLSPASPSNPIPHSPHKIPTRPGQAALAGYDRGRGGDVMPGTRIRQPVIGGAAFTVIWSTGQLTLDVRWCHVGGW